MISMKQALEILRPESQDIRDIRAAYDSIYRKVKDHTYATLLTGLVNEAYNVIRRDIEYWDDYICQIEPESILPPITKKLEQLPDYHHMTIEIRGSWIWLSGNTYDHKDELKRIGFRFSREKREWFWHEHTDEAMKRYSTPIALGNHT